MPADLPGALHQEGAAGRRGEPGAASHYVRPCRGARPRGWGVAFQLCPSSVLRRRLAGFSPRFAGLALHPAHPHHAHPQLLVVLQCQQERRDWCALCRPRTASLTTTNTPPPTHPTPPPAVPAGRRGPRLVRQAAARAEAELGEGLQQAAHPAGHGRRCDWWVSQGHVQHTPAASKQAQPAQPARFGPRHPRRHTPRASSHTA